MTNNLQDRALDYLDELVRTGEMALTSAGLARRFDLSAQSASNLCTRLVRKGLIDRVARGRYAIRQLGLLGTPAAAEAVTLAVGAAFGDEPHRIAYRSALSHHDLIQHSSRAIQVALSRQVRASSLSSRPLQTIYEDEETLAIGSESAGTGAKVSNLERALVDAGRRPDLVGGLDVIAEALVAAHSDINWDRLSEYLEVPAFMPSGRRLKSVCTRIGMRWGATSTSPPSFFSLIKAYPPSKATSQWRDTINGVVWSSTDLDSVPPAPSR